jgi:phosphoribosylanthranilate isomerase
MGFIFYENSPRFAEPFPNLPQNTFNGIKKVGVFVNHSFEQIISRKKQYQLNVVQLHGDESPDLAERLMQSGLEVIKVFRVKDRLPLTQINTFKGKIDYLLFDTRTKKYGGSGEKFDWQILDNDSVEVPYFLSGGIDLEDIEAIKKLRLPRLVGIDVNSRFELEPGVKSIEKLRRLKALL